MRQQPSEEQRRAETSAGQPRFDLHFHGEVLPGQRRDATIAAFARLFAIDDRHRAERFFRGEKVTLRRNLSRDEAAGLYVRLRRIGMVVELRPAVANAPSPPVSSAGVAGTPAPNLYALAPCASDPLLPARARQLTKALWSLAGFAALAALLLAALYTRLPPPPSPPLLHAAAVGEQGELWLVTDDALLPHDRSGRGLEPLALAELGISDPVVDLAIGRTDQLWLLTEAEDGTRLLQHCALAPPDCRALTAGELLDLQWLPREKHLILTHRAGLQLLDAEGRVLALSERQIARDSHLEAFEGLLLVTSPEGPALSVLRPEAAHFGEQLDELLLLPPGALDAGLAHSAAFARAPESWWVTLADAAGTRQQVHRFDPHWQPLDQVTLPFDFRVDILLAWGDRVLAVDLRRDSLLRFSASGEPLAPLPVKALQTQRRELAARAAKNHLLWYSAGWLLGSVALTAGIAGLWQYLRGRILGATATTRVSAPLRSPETMLWLRPDRRRLTRLLQLTLGLSVLALGSLSLFVALGLATHALGGLLLLLGSSALGIWWLSRAPLDMLALRGNQVVLVDHRGRYRSGPGPEAQWNAGFIALGDLVIFTGGSGLPALDTASHQRELGLLFNHAARLPALKTLVLLLENRHPLGIALLLLLTGTIAGSALMLAA